MRALERSVLGCDFGGTSWTTQAQADVIPAALGLKSGTSLLEIGAGSGWPGLYMASSSGCDITLLDIPLNTLRHASQRATEENISHLSNAVAASGAALPFRDAAFDAIGHSDVLCCLPEKLEMLEECRRVVNAGAKMLFFVIAPASNLTGADLKEACEIGPPFVGTPDNYENLLKASAWKLLRKTELTTEYRNALQRLTNGLETGREELQAVMGRETFKQNLQYRKDQITAIDRGLLVREMYVAQAV